MEVVLEVSGLSDFDGWDGVDLTVTGGVG